MTHIFSNINDFCSKDDFYQFEDKLVLQCAPGTQILASDVPGWSICKNQPGSPLYNPVDNLIEIHLAALSALNRKCSTPNLKDSEGSAQSHFIHTIHVIKSSLISVQWRYRKIMADFQKMDSHMKSCLNSLISNESGFSFKSVSGRGTLLLVQSNQGPSGFFAVRSLPALSQP